MKLAKGDAWLGELNERAILIEDVREVVNEI